VDELIDADAGRKRCLPKFAPGVAAHRHGDTHYGPFEILTIKIAIEGVLAQELQNVRRKVSGTSGHSSCRNSMRRAEQGFR
jgi:hypothetical protein